MSHRPKWTDDQVREAWEESGHDIDQVADVLGYVPEHISVRLRNMGLIKRKQPSPRIFTDDALAEAWSSANGDVEAAASLLGASRQTVTHHAKRMGLLRSSSSRGASRRSSLVQTAFAKNRVDRHREIGSHVLKNLRVYWVIPQRVEELRAVKRTLTNLGLKVPDEVRDELAQYPEPPEAVYGPRGWELKLSEGTLRIELP